ncbi:3-deoxy-D-manno-octulosonic acid transferase [Labrys monachus]|uniref:3-deoxy-D-manno-octulosonic acid transferase n=1 Tax=Labrys monachus TaxID=217067 RepID=A0ABU0FC02_9HYPH|nr:3-deoxy-D-manno-octulosonic acid transferase [Labrys monachus]MDQ0391590.1 3-deoxy-D-manno-octulosonic-acid transferase [Labrys monachus]
MKAGSPVTLRLYRAATAGFGPFAGLLLARRQRRGKEDAARKSERLGIAGRPRPEGRLCWLHGASVGEAVTILPVAERLAAQGFRILLTTGTVTSAALMAQRLPEGAIHQFVPLDVPVFVRRFLAHWRPDLALFVESELWPAMISEISAAGIPLALVNGRMSPRSFQRWQKAPRTIGALLRCFDLCAAQSADDGARIAALGAPHVISTGNLKFDTPPPPADPVRLEALQEAVEGRPLWLAASTHAGEEALAGAVHEKLKGRFPGLLTIIVPRHPDRGAAIAADLSARGLACLRRSEGRLPEDGTDIYIADTVGELGLFYRLARIVFVGKSLVGRGGQNPVEPAKLGASVLHGPFVHNFVEAYGAFDAMGGAITVRDGEELTAAVGRLLADPGAVARLAEAGAQAVASLSGALDRTMQALAGLAANETP